MGISCQDEGAWLADPQELLSDTAFRKIGRSQFGIVDLTIFTCDYYQWPKIGIASFQSVSVI